MAEENESTDVKVPEIDLLRAKEEHISLESIIERDFVSKGAAHLTENNKTYQATPFIWYASGERIDQHNVH